MNFTAEPLFFRVHRWHASMAQYPVGHAGRVNAIEERYRTCQGCTLRGMHIQESAFPTASGPGKAPRRRRWILWDWGRRRQGAVGSWQKGVSNRQKAGASRPCNFRFATWIRRAKSRGAIPLGAE